jgi:putative endonuclease
MPPLEKIRIKSLESFLDWLDRLTARRRREPQHLANGRRGERAAFFHLRRLGFVVTAQRWRTPKAAGDLDLVAWDNDVLCFVEVKTRTTRAVAPAEAAVDTDKKRMLRKMAHHYLRQLPNRDVPVRFDILSIYFEAGSSAEFTLFRGAFGWQ